MSKELLRGIKVEGEHADVINFISKVYKTTGKMPSKKEIYKRIAAGHLKEDPKYYTKLSKYKL